MSDDMDDVAELDGEVEDQAEGHEAPEMVEDAPGWLEIRDVANVLERVLGEEQLTDRELVRGFLEAIAALPNKDKLRHNLSPAVNDLASRRVIVKKHGRWMWIPIDERGAPAEKHHDKKKPSAPAALARFLIWPPLHEPCGQLLPAGDDQARMWIRCARPGCHRRQEVMFYLVGLTAEERAALAPAEIALGWACPPCAVVLHRLGLTREQRAVESQALRAMQRPMPSPSVICTLLRKGTSEGDALARDQLRIHREGIDGETFERMMSVVFVELDQMAPTTKSPGKIAQHRARVGAFRLFAGWAAPVAAPPAPRRRPTRSPPPPLLPRRSP